MTQALERHQSPNTRKRWVFPKDTKRYLALVHMRDASYAGAPECENGHFGCAAWESGPCADRVESAYLNPEPKA